MTIRTTLITSSLIAASLVSGAAHAVLQGRDLNGSVGSAEAYYDTVLNITWLADANYAAGSSFDDINGTGSTTTDGKMTWANANAWAANLSFTNPLTNQTYANWRLPTVEPVNGSSFNYDSSVDGSTDWGINITSTQSEMSHLFYVTLGNLGQYTPAGGFRACASMTTCLENPGPFSNLQTYSGDLIYWSATEYQPDSGNPERAAWYFSFDAGNQAAANEFADFYALAVSPGDVGIAAVAVPEADTWAMLLAGLGLVGVATRRRRG